MITNEFAFANEEGSLNNSIVEKKSGHASTHRSRTRTQAIRTDDRNAWHAAMEDTIQQTALLRPDAASSVAGIPAEPRFQPHLLSPSTTAECVQVVARPGVVPHVVEEDVVEVYSGDMIPHHESRWRVSAAQDSRESSFGFGGLEGWLVVFD